MNQDSRHVEFMNLAMDQARIAYTLGEVPIGAVIVKDDEVIACSYNQTEQLQNPTGHAELLVIESASKKLKTRRLLDCTLYVTLEPCAMCAGAIQHARISRLVYGAADPKTGACGSVVDLFANRQLAPHTSVTSGVLAEQSSALLRGFFAQRRKSKAGRADPAALRSDPSDH